MNNRPLARNPSVPDATQLPATPMRAPVYPPGWSLIMAILWPQRQKPDCEAIEYDRGISVQRKPEQVTIIKNSDFQPLYRGPIDWAYVRQWWWRYPYVQSDDVMPQGHPLPTLDGTINTAPGASIMTARPSFRFTVSTPAWTIPPSTQQAQDNFANG